MTNNLFGLMDEATGITAFVVCLLCFAGLRSERFRDNWAQNIGMAIVFISCLPIIYHAFTAHRGSWRVASFLVGVAVYGCGVAWKTWQSKHHYQGEDHGEVRPPIAARSMK